MALPQTGNIVSEIKKGLHGAEQEASAESGEMAEINTQELTSTVASAEAPNNTSRDGDLDKLNAIRKGPLTAVAVPTEPVDDKTLAEIKKHLFPTIDFEKTNPTPQELVNYLLLNHSMKLEQAHDWIEFLASNGNKVA